MQVELKYPHRAAPVTNFSSWINLDVIVVKQRCRTLCRLRKSRHGEKHPQRTEMATSPRPSANDRFPEASDAKRNSALLPSENSFPLIDTAAAPRDVLIALTYGLKLARHGAMLVTEGGRPQLANGMAMAILRKQDGLSLARTGLVAERASDTRLLHKLLQEAISSPEAGEPRESPFTLKRKSSHKALIVRVTPGPGLDCWHAPDRRTALLKLYDQDLGLVVDERALVSLYGLTRGEAALAAKLVQGKSIEEAAGELYISAHTARTHLKRIFMKTDTHRQPELVVRMMMIVL